MVFVPLSNKKNGFCHFYLVGMSGLEPPTPTLSEKLTFCLGLQTGLEMPKNQAFLHIENEIDVNKKYTPDIN